MIAPDAHKFTKFELDAMIHCCQSAADQLAVTASKLKMPDSERGKEIIARAEMQQRKYEAYAGLWLNRFGHLWMQKIPWEGEVLKALTDWYRSMEPEHAPPVDERLEATV